MKAFALAVAIAMAPSAALAGSILPSFGFKIDLAMSSQQQLATACLIAIASSGPAPASDPKQTVEWCARAAAHLFSLYPRHDTAAPRETPPKGLD